MYISNRRIINIFVKMKDAAYLDDPFFGYLVSYQFHRNMLPCKEWIAQVIYNVYKVISLSFRQHSLLKNISPFVPFRTACIDNIYSWPVCELRSIMYCWCVMELLGNLLKMFTVFGYSEIQISKEWEYKWCSLHTTHTPVLQTTLKHVCKQWWTTPFIFILYIKAASYVFAFTLEKCLKMSRPN